MSIFLRRFSACLLACAALTLVVAPRRAYASFVEVDTGYYGYYTTNTDVLGVGLEYQIMEAELTHTYNNGTYSGTEHTGFLIVPDSSNYVVDPSKRLKVSIGYVFNRYLAPGTQYYSFVPPTFATAWRASNFSYARGLDINSSDFYFSMWYCPYGSDPVYSSNYKELSTVTPEVSYSGGIYTINESVIAISYRYYTKSPINTYSWYIDLVQNGSYSIDAFRPCFASLPQLFVQPVGMQDDLSGISVTVDNLGTVTNSISAQTTSLNSSISTQTNSINSNIDAEVQGQTDTLMDTTGSDSIVDDLTEGGYSGFVQDRGFFGQVGDIVSSTISPITSGTANSVVHFPGITVLGITIAPASDVDIWQGDLVQLRNPVRMVCTFMLIVAWINGMHYLIDVQILGMTPNKEDMQ